MSIDILRIILDFGLLVLIWVVQRIIYPGFQYYNADNLIVWHRKYTLRIGFIVAPLMIGQLGISLGQVFFTPSIYTVVSLIFIVLVWISTFLQFVPMHTNISKGVVSEKLLRSLVYKNWLRTFLWTVLFLMSLYHLLTKTHMQFLN
ncbi:MAG: hypothetical protein WBM98_15345 [Maribacter sp.]|uniref:hypothetical protein n=1 Tax=Maribacter sp. TaxID=1897614 RepID=UPI003C757C93